MRGNFRVDGGARGDREEKAMFCEAFSNTNEVCILITAGILQNNIICGDSLKIQEQWIKENENVENSKKLQE